MTMGIETLHGDDVMYSAKYFTLNLSMTNAWMAYRMQDEFLV